MCSPTTCKRYGKIVLILNWMWDIVHWTIQQYWSSHKLEHLWTLHQQITLYCLGSNWKNQIKILYIYCIIHINIFLIGENLPKSETENSKFKWIDFGGLEYGTKKNMYWKFSDFYIWFSEGVAKNMKAWLNICKFHIWFIWFI